MTLNRQRAKLGGCVLAPSNTSYRLRDGMQTHAVAVPLSLVLAEPCMRKLADVKAISCEEAAARGYRFVRNYDEAVAYGIA
jgi:hypothetical protein